MVTNSRVANNKRHRAWPGNSLSEGVRPGLEGLTFFPANRILLVSQYSILLMQIFVLPSPLWRQKTANLVS